MLWEPCHSLIILKCSPKGEGVTPSHRDIKNLDFTENVTFIFCYQTRSLNTLASKIMFRFLPVVSQGNNLFIKFQFKTTPANVTKKFYYNFLY